jgi:hypothetical protein
MDITPGDNGNFVDTGGQQHHFNFTARPICFSLVVWQLLVDILVNLIRVMCLCIRAGQHCAQVLCRDVPARTRCRLPYACTMTTTSLAATTRTFRRT